MNLTYLLAKTPKYFSLYITSKIQAEC